MLDHLGHLRLFLGLDLLLLPPLLLLHLAPAPAILLAIHLSE